MTAKPRVLIIDDEAPFLFVLETTLVAEGYETKTAPNAEEAAALEEKEHFDVIMTDIIMPGKDGFQIIAELRKRQPLARIIAMSGGWQRGSDSYLRMARKMGASRTLAKPFSKQALLDAVSGEEAQQDC